MKCNVKMTNSYIADICHCLTDQKHCTDVTRLQSVSLLVSV